MVGFYEDGTAAIGKRQQAITGGKAQAMPQ